MTETQAGAQQRSVPKVHFTDAESVSMAPQVGEALISFGEPSVLSCELAGADRASGLTTVTDLSRYGIPDSAGGWLHNYATRMVA